MHHDNGPLGAATIDRAEARRVELLKANGAASTSSRTAPYTPRAAHRAPRTAPCTACCLTRASPRLAQGTMRSAPRTTRCRPPSNPNPNPNPNPNQVSPAFLAACDRVGMLVMDEAFDC